MNKFSVLCIIFFFYTVNIFTQSIDSLKVSCTYSNTPYLQIINDIENKYNIYFYYKKEWFDSFNVTIKCSDIKLESFMKSCLEGSDLKFLIKEPRSVFIFERTLILDELPNYQYSIKIDSQNTASADTKDDFLKGRNPNITKTIVIGKRNMHERNSQKVAVNGVLINIQSKELLLGATMFIKELETGVASDRNGKINIKLLPGKYTAVFQCLGMADFNCLLDVCSEGSFTVEMNTKRTSIQEVSIKADLRKSRGAIVGYERISLKEIKEMPTLMGEKDIIKVSQFLPGVVSVNEGSAGVNVRGGGADQNIFYFNKVPIYNTSHVFGFFSAINSTIINDFVIYKAHVPAAYGGRLSSVFDIETRKPNTEDFFMQGGVSPVSANIELEIPLVNERVGLMASGRSSYSDWILNQMKDPALRNSSTRFSDFALSLNYSIDDANNFDAFGYTSNDYFSLNQLTDNKYSNLGGAINYKHWFSRKFRSNVSLVASNYSFSTLEKNIPAESYSHSYKLEHYEARIDFSLEKYEKHTFEWGAGSILYRLNRGVIEPAGLESIIVTNDLGVEKGIESSIYLSDKFALNSWLNLYVGLRYSSFTLLGPSMVNRYSPNKPYNEENILDTINFKNNQKVANYNKPEIRLALDFEIGNSNSIKLSYVEMNQYLFMLSNSISITPTDQWKLVDYNIKPQGSSQIALGFYRSDNALGADFSTEFYYKKGANIVEYKDGVSFISGLPVESTILQGKQNAYGIEFMVSKNKGQLNGWLSYTYSRSLIKVDGSEDWAKINKGLTYPSNYDKPHVLNVVGNWKINRRLIFSSNVTYSTGRPITVPKSVFYINDSPFVEYSKRNEFRVPDYFRLDFSLTIEGNLKARKALHSSWMLSAYNATGRKNVNSIYFVSDEGQLKGYKYSIIGTPIYTVSWIFKLGNYAND